MQATYRLIGIELSPYSVKVRAYLRYKGLPHVWLTRNDRTQAEFEKHARLPLVPLLITPQGEGLQDSTPILEELERRHPEPGLRPSDPVAAFVSDLLEEYADEWGNKWMFHYRWAREVDQWSGAHRIARNAQPDADASAIEVLAARIRERMIGRMGFVGSNPRTAPLIERSYGEVLEFVDAHLARFPYLMGGRPGMADFGLWAQLYEAWTDPTAGSLIEARAPSVLAWIHRMCWPRVEGPFEPWSSLEDSLKPLLAREIGGRFLPWSAANERALQASADSFDVELEGGSWTQKPQKYHARSLAALRAKFASVRELPELIELVESVGAYDVLAEAS